MKSRSAVKASRPVVLHGVAGSSVVVRRDTHRQIVYISTSLPYMALSIRLRRQHSTVINQTYTPTASNRLSTDLFMANLIITPEKYHFDEL